MTLCCIARNAGAGEVPIITEKHTGEPDGLPGFGGRYYSSMTFPPLASQSSLLACTHPWPLQLL